MPPQPMIISARQCWSDGPTEWDEKDGSKEDNTSEDREDNVEGDDSEQVCLFFFHDIFLFFISFFP